MPAAQVTLSKSKTSGGIFTTAMETASYDPLVDAIQIIKDRLYYSTFKSDPRSTRQNESSWNPRGTVRDTRSSSRRRNIHYFCIDSELVYWNFYLDFGPLNLGQLYRFCQKLNLKLEDSRLKNRVICFYSNTSPAKHANAVFLICAWQVLYLKRTPEEAYHGFRNDVLSVPDISSPGSRSITSVSSSPRNASIPPCPRADGSESHYRQQPPLPPFHDASPCVCTYNLTVLDCLRGLSKACMYSFFNFDNFNIEEYEYFEQVENGDLNWIMDNKIIAFAGPHQNRQITPEGYCTLTPSDYIPYFKRKNIGLVVRLNKRFYDEDDFRKAGINHFEQYYLDGSCPPMKILQKVLEAFESVPHEKGFAVHCKAGLGRTGTCIGAYMMKHYKFTAAEAIGWMRICRPGMVIGPQQHFLQDLEQRMWYEGDMMRINPSQCHSLRIMNYNIDDYRNKGHMNCEDQNEEVNMQNALVGSTKKISNSKTVLSNLKVIDKLEVGEQRQCIRLQHGDESFTGRVGQADGLLARRAQGVHISAANMNNGDRRQDDH